LGGGGDLGAGGEEGEGDGGGEGAGGGGGEAGGVRHGVGSEWPGLDNRAMIAGEGMGKLGMAVLK
jgi:hypothetical protein